MLASRVLSRVSRSVGRRASVLLSTQKKQQLPILVNHFHSLVYESPNTLVTSQVSLLHHSALNSSTFQRFGFSSSASPEPSENNGAEPKVSDEMEDSGTGETKATETKESDSESEGDLSMDDLVKIVAEMDELLKTLDKQIEKSLHNVHCRYIEVENDMDWTKRNAEKSKEFAIQNFSKSLLDVADNLGRVASSVKDSLAKIDASQDTAGAVPVIKTLLEGVEMTEKQLVELVTSQVSLLHHSALNSSTFQRFGFSSSASPEPSENNGAEPKKTSGDPKVSDEMEDSGTGETKATETKESGFDTEFQSTLSQYVKRRRGTKQTAFSDSYLESEGDLSMDDLAKLVVEKVELLKIKYKDLEKTKDDNLRRYIEMEHDLDTTKCEAEKSKEFAIQNFAESLLDVADNLERAASSVKDSLAKIDASQDTAGAVPVIKTLLEGVEMTEKQLVEVFKGFGVVKFDPRNEIFFPHLNEVVFQVPVNSKRSGRVVDVLKAGYRLHGRVIRQAVVGVTQAVENDASENEGGLKMKALKTSS